MIRNENELRVTKARLDEFIAQIESTRHELEEQHATAELIQLATDPLVVLAGELEFELASYYERLRTESLAQLFSVTALLFRGKQVLAVSRKTNHEDLGLPGGKLDYGETPEQALVRELREETGITALRFIQVFEDPCRVENGESRPSRVYLVYSWEGEPQAVENAIVEWVLPERLFEPSNSFHDYNIKLFEHLNKTVE